MKRIFFYTDVLPFLEDGEDAIEKLRRDLETFRQAEDKVEVIWHPYHRTEEFLRLNKSEVTTDYLNLVELFIKEKWGILDNTSEEVEIKKVLFSCDAFFGDVGNLVYEAKETNIPVMIRNIHIF